MSETPSEALIARLIQVERPGGYYAHGAEHMPLPELSVDGVGRLSLPIPPAQIEQLIEQASPAPYGLGSQTLVDAEVRRTWQLSPDRFTIGGAAWEATLGRVTASAKAGLGVRGTVISQLYKLLIYEEGDFFAEHRDTEKLPGMFGTLVVVLPTRFSGGELRVCHAGREVVLPVNDEGLTQIEWAAFYADCVHEVWPLTDGHRVVLIYNLLVKGRRTAVPTPDNRQAIADVAEHLRGWDDGWPTKMLYLLEHKYSIAGLSMHALKGRDAAIAGVLIPAAEQAECAVHLAMVSIQEAGSATCYQPYRSRYSHWGRRSYYEDDIEQSDDDFEVEEVFDQACTVSHWLTSDNRPGAMGPLGFEATELVPQDGLDDATPDEQSFHEATGNEGASFERTYLNAALVIWPLRQTMRVLAAGPRSSTVPFLGQLVEDPGRRADAVTLAHTLIEGWREATGPTIELLLILSRLADADALRSLVAQSTTGRFHRSLAPALVEATRATGWNGTYFTEQLTAADSDELEGWLRLLALLAAAPEQPARDLSAKLLGPLSTRLPRDDDPPQGWRGLPPFDAEALGDLYGSLRWATEARIVAVVAHLLQHPARFPLDAIIEACVESPWYPSALREACTTFLEARIAVDIRPPDHWRQDVKVSPCCADCQALYAFMLIDERVGRFPLAKARRQHLHNIIDHGRYDLTHVTERRGRPYTLVCTKTRDSYGRKAIQRTEDQARLKTFRSHSLAPGP